MVSRLKCHSTYLFCKKSFAAYTLTEFNEDLFMINTLETRIAGTRKVMLKIHSGKLLTLDNVLHVPTIRKNLVSIALLIKNGFKCVLVRQSCNNEG